MDTCLKCNIYFVLSLLLELRLNWTFPIKKFWYLVSRSDVDQSFVFGRYGLSWYRPRWYCFAHHNSQMREREKRIFLHFLVVIIEYLGGHWISGSRYLNVCVASMSKMSVWKFLCIIFVYLFWFQFLCTIFVFITKEFNGIKKGNSCKLKLIWK